MRRAARVDANQPEIVAALRKSGCGVEHLHQVGGGCPDILVGIDGINLLLEIKDGSKPPSARKLTSDQVEWHGKWLGQKAVVSTVEEALQAVASCLSLHGRTAPQAMTDMLTAFRSSSVKSRKHFVASSARHSRTSSSHGSRKRRTTAAATHSSRTCWHPNTTLRGRAASSKA